MKATRFITAFFFDTARYRLADERGRDIFLILDYAHNRYEVETAGVVVSPRFRREADGVARDLLARKHGVNFVQSA